jgi:hypothetical protein
VPIIPAIMWLSTWQWYSHVPGSSSFQRMAKVSAGPTVWVSTSVPNGERQRDCGEGGRGASHRRVTW